MDEKIRIIIADDHPVFMFGLKTMLSGVEAFEVVGTATNGKDTVDMCRSLKPDVLLLDIMMPVMDGIEVAKIMEGEYMDTKVLMLSADTTPSSIDELLQIGVDGFVSKNAPASDIINAVTSVAEGYNYYGTDVARIIERLHTAKSTPEVVFTQREMDVIELSCQGLQYKEIADRLNIKTKTVDNIKSNIFRKLGINNTVELVRYAIKKGIIII